MNTRKAGKGRKTRARPSPSNSADLARACIGEVKEAPSIQPGEWNRLFRWALEDAPISCPAQRLVLATLVCRVNSSLTCFPSIPYIMEKTGLGRNKIRKALRELESEGWIVRIRRGRQGQRGGRTTDYYRLQDGFKGRQSDFESDSGRFKSPQSDFELNSNSADNNVSIRKTSEDNSADSKSYSRTRILDLKTTRATMKPDEAQSMADSAGKTNQICPECGEASLFVEQEQIGEYRYCLRCNYSLVVGESK